ncbi:MAG: nucleoside phosphorylase [Flavobacteriales bacterium]
MTTIKDTELIITKDNKIYHLNIDKNQIAKNIILVGDQDRVSQISKYFDEITEKIQHREFVTHTGFYKGKKITALSTGIGCDNIDIVVNELDALVNIDFENRTINSEKTQLNLIRLGTSGSLQENIKIDSFLMSKYALGFDGLAHFHDNKKCIDKNITKSFITHSNWPSQLSEPYIIKASESLLKRFNGITEGITATASGFYAPQGREIRLKLAIPNMHHTLNTFEFNGNKIANFEMESSALYYLGQSLGHNTLTICAIIGNRINQTQSSDYKKIVEKLIVKVLDKI